MTTVDDATTTLLDAIFGLERGDRLVLVADPGKRALAAALEAPCAARGVAFEAVELASEEAYELPGPVAAAVAGATAALIATRRSYTHTDGVRRAVAGGARVATNAGLSEAQLLAGLAVDPSAVADRAVRYAALLGPAHHVTIVSGDGAELSFTVAHQRAFAETGVYRTPGDLGNLPAGEAACGIDDGTGEGVLVVDGSWPGLGVLDAPLELRIAAGAVVEVRGARAAELEALLDRHGPAARRLAELGLGMNPAFDLQGVTLLDEKIAGTIHVAVGNDVSFGGSNDVGYHADGVVRSPRLLLDGRAVDLPTR